MDNNNTNNNNNNVNDIDSQGTYMSEDNNFNMDSNNMHMIPPNSNADLDDKEEEEYEDDVSKKNLFLLILLLLILVILIIGVTYQVYLYTTSGKSLINEIFGRGNPDVFHNGTVTVVYTEGENDITIENAIPMTDDAGMKLSSPDQLMDFTVSVDITKSSTVSCEIAAEKDSSSTISNDDIKLYIQRSINKPTYEEEVLMPTHYVPLKEDDDYGVPSGSMVIDQFSISKSIKYYYRLRMWLDSHYQLSGEYKFFKIKINVYSKGERIRGGKDTKDDDNVNSTNNSSTSY